MRKSRIERKTTETDIEIKLRIEGKGKYNIKTPIKFLNHLLENFTKHGLYDIEIKASGDIWIDQHHLIEDLGLSLGKAFKKALKQVKSVNRTGFFAFPMDDTLGITAIDLSGRPFSVFKARFKRQKCGDLDTDLLPEFFKSFAAGLQCNLAVYVPYGTDDHHKIESIFKSFGKCLKVACTINKKIKVPSTKKLVDMTKC